MKSRGYQYCCPNSPCHGLKWCEANAPETAKYYGGSAPVFVAPTSLKDSGLLDPLPSEVRNWYGMEYRLEDVIYIETDIIKPPRASEPK